MIRIGIVAFRTVEEENRPFKDKFCFVNNFGKRIKESGAIPYGIIFPDGKFEEDFLDIYDGFFFHSGSHIQPFHLALLHYAILNNKPVFGVCLGHQVIGTYAYVIDCLKKMNMDVSYKNIISYFSSIMDNEDLFLIEVQGHDPEPIFYNDSVDKALMPVYLDKNSLIYDIYKKDKIMAPSLHRWALRNVYGDFKVTGRSEEGYIETIEYTKDGRFVLGTQFHAELCLKDRIVFERFIEEVKKRK